LLKNYIKMWQLRYMIKVNWKNYKY
jgi:hypothetical protein